MGLAGSRSVPYIVSAPTTNNTFQIMENNGIETWCGNIKEKKNRVVK